MAIMTGLSGNEMFCLHLKGFAPGELERIGLSSVGAILGIDLTLTSGAP